MIIHAPLTQMNTNIVQNLQSQVLKLQLISSILFYILIANVIFIFHFVAGPLIGLEILPSSTNIRLNMLFYIPELSGEITNYFSRYFTRHVKSKVTYAFLPIIVYIPMKESL